MSTAGRLAALEETVDWLRHELEQLDATARAQAAAQDRLLQRLERLERRLDRIEQGAGNSA